MSEDTDIRMGGSGIINRSQTGGLPLWVKCWWFVASAAEFDKSGQRVLGI